MVTIIVTVYNKELYIEKCLQSIKEQTFVDYVCYVINDGSTDSSERLVHDVVGNDKRFNYIKTQNKGVSAARNRGLSLAKTKFIVFMDGDDWWQRDFLQNLVPFTDGGYSMIAATYEWVDQQNTHYVGEVDGRIIELEPSDYFMELIQGNYGVHTSSTFVNVGYLSDIGGFPEGVHCGEDSFCWDQLIYKSKLLRISKHLSNYNNYRKEGLTQRKIPIGPLISYYVDNRNFNKYHNIYKSKIFFAKLLYDLKCYNISAFFGAYTQYKADVGVNFLYMLMYFWLRIRRK